MPIWHGNCCKPNQPRLVAIGGLSGTGKSLLARTLASEIMPMPGAVVLRSDIERKAMFSVAETETLSKSAYTAEATAKVYATLAAKARRVVAAGHSAIVDAVFAQPVERADIAKAADSADFTGLFLTADLQSRLERVGARTRDASDANRGDCARSGKIRAGPHQLGESRCVRHPGRNLHSRQGGAQPGMIKLCIARAAVPPSFPLGESQRTKA